MPPIAVRTARPPVVCSLLLRFLDAPSNVADFGVLRVHALEQHIDFSLEPSVGSYQGGVFGVAWSRRHNKGSGNRVQNIRTRATRRDARNQNLGQSDGRSIRSL